MIQVTISLIIKLGQFWKWKGVLLITMSAQWDCLGQTQSHDHPSCDDIDNDDGNNVIQCKPEELPRKS